VPTLVVLMGLSVLPEITDRLLEEGAAPETPVAVIASGTLPAQRTVLGTLATIVARVAAARLESPATVVIGAVVATRVGLTPSARQLVSHA
jgi:siroheme synthase